MNTNAKRFIASVAFALATSVFLLAPAPSLANPTGSPLVHYPLEPCRVLDTRVSIGPVLSGTGTIAFVRGSNLPASQGASLPDCGVPLAAESVTVNVVAINPTAAGHLRVNGVGFIHGPKGIYSRLNFAAGQTIANEMEVSLCNAALFPNPHQPCPWDNQGHYQDIAIVPDMIAGASVHIVADVVGYSARMPLTSAVAGLVNNQEVRPTATALLLTTGMRVVCELPHSAPSNCDFVQPGWTVKAAGHVGYFEGNLAIYAHGAIQEDQN